MEIFRFFPAPREKMNRFFDGGVVVVVVDVVVVLGKNEKNGFGQIWIATETNLGRRCIQCDQICQNFTTLAKIETYLRVYLEFS